MSDSKVFMVPDNACSGNNTAETLALMNSQNNWNNNPFMYLIWLAFFGNGGLWGNRADTALNADLARQMQTMLGTITDNHNNDLAMQAIQGNGKALTELAGNLNVGVATLSNAISNIKGAIDLVGSLTALGSERVVNSVLMGNKDLMQQIATCCCENKQLVTTMGYEGQLRDQANTCAITTRIGDLANGVLTGFASTAYETAQQTCAIQNSLKDLTQTIIDKISNMEANAQLDKINSLTAQLTAANSRAERLAELAPIIAQLNAIKSAQPSTATVQYPQLTVIPSAIYNMLGGLSYGSSSSTPGFWN